MSLYIFSSSKPMGYLPWVWYTWGKKSLTCRKTRTRSTGMGFHRYGYGYGQNYPWVTCAEH